MEENELHDDLVQNIIKLSVASMSMKLASEWEENGENEDDNKLVDVTIKVPKLMIDAMGIVMRDLEDNGHIEKICGASIAFHCKRFDTELPERFVYPKIPKFKTAKEATENFIGIHVANTLINNLGSEITDKEKYHDTCDLIGAILMRIIELRAKGEPDGSGD